MKRLDEVREISHDAQFVHVSTAEVVRGDDLWDLEVGESDFRCKHAVLSVLGWVEFCNVRGYAWFHSIDHCYQGPVRKKCGCIKVCDVFLVHNFNMFQGV